MVRLFGKANFSEVRICVSGVKLLPQEMALEGSF